MNKILLNYLLKNFLKTLFVFILIFYSFGIILNLFEEIEFFKNKEASVFMPLILTSIYIPSLIIKFLPFIVFVSCMWFMLRIRNNKDLLILKVFGYSNIRIFFILAFTSFFFGWIVLFIINPITSTMAKYYEKTKSNFSRDIDHLININRNGLWIKESTQTGERIIAASNPKNKIINDLTIFHLDKEYNLIEKIISKKANISSNDWLLEDLTIFKFKEGFFASTYYEKYIINSIYNFDRINSLFKNYDTMSFIDLIINYKKLRNNGYNPTFLNQSLHSLLTIPFFLFLMTAIASILTLNNLKKSNNFRYIRFNNYSFIVLFKRFITSIR